MAWRCHRVLAARPSQVGHFVAEISTQSETVVGVVFSGRACRAPRCGCHSSPCFFGILQIARPRAPGRGASLLTAQIKHANAAFGDGDAASDVRIKASNYRDSSVGKEDARLGYAMYVRNVDAFHRYILC